MHGNVTRSILGKSSWGIPLRGFDPSRGFNDLLKRGQYTITQRKGQCNQTYQKRPPARASNAAPPTAIPTIDPVDKPELPLSFELLVSVASLAAAVVVELDVDSVLVAVAVAVSAKFCIDVFTSAGSG